VNKKVEHVKKTVDKLNDRLIQTFKTNPEAFMAQENKNDVTRERLLNVAEALFAQRGYHGVSVREITTDAKSNLAAVNYHFGNKKNLYVEVFKARWVPRARRMQKGFRESLGREPVTSPTQVVRALAKAFLEGPLSDEERVRHHQLIARELGEPTEAFELLAKDVMRPFFRELAQMLRKFLPEAPEESMMLNMLSIFAQVLYFNFARFPVTRITGQEYDPAFKARLVEHITEFSVKGLGNSHGGVRS
jgi:AcrR family transcriptional regulator